MEAHSDVIQTSRLPQVSQPIRVLLAKVGLDGHDRGVRIVARALRDAGMEVVYTGLHRRPEEVVTAAIHEDVDVLGVSILSGAHMTIFPRIIDLLRTEGVLDEILLVGGGVIPDEDVLTLKELGVAEILGQETAPGDVVATVRRLVARSRDRERDNHQG
jgi:methylmalonyl-CoA mutase cobalamin-binding domain/chain